MSFNVGQSVGDYEVIRALGSGAMGQVYQVKNRITQRVEAMKILLPRLAHSNDLADRFMREIQVLASLDHPNIAALYTAQRVDNQLLMIMEFVGGTVMAENLLHKATSLEQGLDYVRQMLLALEYAHKHGVIHRDIKPTNIMITPGGKVKVMDFGIAKVAGDGSLTQTGTTLGSAFYMSPEQVKGNIQVDGRSDLYSVGVIMYEIATGRLPFVFDNQYAVMAAHVQTSPVPPSEVAPGLPAYLNDIILKALAKEPSQRFQTAEDFLNALNAPGSFSDSRDPLGSLFGASTGTQSEWSMTERQVEPSSLGPPPSRSHRTLYMVLGSVLALIGLAIVASVAPKFFKADAQGHSVPATRKLSPSPAYSAPLGDIVPSSEVPSSSRVVTEQGTGAGIVIKDSQPAGSDAVRANVKETHNSRRPERTVQAPADGSIPKASHDQAERLIDLESRAKTINSSWETMRSQLKSQGLDLRQNISEELNRMNAYLEGAQAALRSGDANGANDYMDRLENEVKRLEAEGK